MGERGGLLEQVKVVEVATFVLAPAAGTVMADHGADVIKVEPLGIGDPYRMLYRFAPLPSCETYDRERTGHGSRASTSLLANGAWTNGGVHPGGAVRRRALLALQP